MSLKTQRLEMRLTPEDKQLLEQAAALRGVAVTSFALTLLVENARAIVEASQRTTLSRADQERFLALLDEEQEPKPALVEAVRRLKKHRG